MSATGIAARSISSRTASTASRARTTGRERRVALNLDAQAAGLRPGDLDSFDGVVDAYQTPVYNLCARMLWDSQEAEDAAQETFLRAYRNLPRYDPQRRFGTWLLSIAAHHCIDRLRRRRLPVVGGEDGWETPDPAPGPEAAFERREHQEAVERMLQALGPLDRAAIVLRFWYDLSYEEMASALSLPVNTVKSRIHRAKRRLAEEWMQITVPIGLAPARAEAA